MINTSTSSLSGFTTTQAPFLAGQIFFSWYDYVIFVAMISLSMGIGIYFGCFGANQNTTKEYLMGGRQMKVIPVVISLVASHTSGVTFLAVPSNVYVFGASYGLGAISFLILIIITNYVFLPIFHKLQLTSTYEYLGLRFDSNTRKLSSFLYALSSFCYLPTVIYIPALAFSAASGIDVHVITPVVCGVCIFYTTIGGLKSLVWTDTIQFSVTMGTLAVICVLAIRATGGITNIWQTSIEGGRLDVFDMDFDLTKRETFWTIIVGLTIHWVAHTSINQGCTQKFLAVATLKESKMTVLYYCLGMVVVKLVSVFSGLMIYTKYAECDPLSAKRIEKNDQILPHFVLDIAGGIPGLPGLFIAGVFCASLSTLSGNLNCLAGTIYEDFLKIYLERKNIKNTGCILKMLVVIIGIISTLLVYIVENLGGVLALAISLGSLAHGPLLGMFILGVIFPRTNAKGAFYGGLSTVAVMSATIFGSNYYKSQHLLTYPHKPISVQGCEFFNSTYSGNSTSSTNPDVFVLFKISFYWYTLMGATICIVVGLIISYLSKENDPPVSRELLSPVIYRFLSKDKYQDKMNLEYDEEQERLNKSVYDEGTRSLSNWEALRRERLRKGSIISDIIDD